MIRLLMVGIGGYGNYYMTRVLAENSETEYEIVGTVDPYAKEGPIVDELRKRNIPQYNTIEEFYEHHTADLAVLSTPIHLHARQSAYCMEHGSDVLCEKPISATLADAEYMIEARNRTGKRLAIGFQWSFADAILNLKKDIQNGVYGTIKQIRTIALFPRDMDYYRRGSGWGGKRYLPTGEAVFDCVASNATAHYLHNMLFLMGETTDTAAEPASITAEVYRANPIEMYDTCALRVMTKAGTELMFYASHAITAGECHRPDFVIVGEKGSVIGTESGGITGTLNDGTTIEYGLPGSEKLRTTAQAIENNTVIPCVIETALPHLKCTCSIAESYTEIPVFAEEYIHYNEEIRQYTCKGLGAVLEYCWQEGKLPSETDTPWAVAPHTITFA